MDQKYFDIAVLVLGMFIIRLLGQIGDTLTRMEIQFEEQFPSREAFHDETYDEP